MNFVSFRLYYQNGPLVSSYTRSNRRLITLQLGIIFQQEEKDSIRIVCLLIPVTHSVFSSATVLLFQYVSIFKSSIYFMLFYGVWGNMIFNIWFHMFPSSMDVEEAFCADLSLGGRIYFSFNPTKLLPVMSSQQVCLLAISTLDQRPP